MKCPMCGEKTHVIDVVHVDEHREVYRKRECSECGRVFFTVEMLSVDNKEVEEIWHKNYRKRRVK